MNPAEPRSTHRSFLEAFGKAAIVAALLAAASCSRSGASQEQPQKRDLAFPVEVQKLEPRRIDYSVNAVGAVEAFENVQITARVAGALEKVLFKEGDAVKKGALLADIEPERYALAVASARAALKRAGAARQEAERELDRVQKMLAEGVGTQVEVGTWQTKLATTSAEESQARAAMGVASLNLRDARVRAPISGTIQTRAVQTGQYVQAGAVLATLIQRDPLLLRFPVNEAEALRMRAGMVASFRVKGDETRYAAKLTHVSGAADPASRMVPILGEVENPPDTLRPGTFAEVSVPIGGTDSALVVPEISIRPSERGFLAYVIDGELARERVLTLGMRAPDGRVEVTQGLKAGELLVVRGAEALKEGAKVRISDGKAPGSAGQPASSSKP